MSMKPAYNAFFFIKAEDSGVSAWFSANDYSISIYLSN